MRNNRVVAWHGEVPVPKGANYLPPFSGWVILSVARLSFPSRPLHLPPFLSVSLEAVVIRPSVAGELLPMCYSPAAYVHRLVTPTERGGFNAGP